MSTKKIIIKRILFKKFEEKKSLKNVEVIEENLKNKIKFVWWLAGYKIFIKYYLTKKTLDFMWIKGGELQIDGQSKRNELKNFWIKNSIYVNHRLLD